MSYETTTVQTLSKPIVETETVSKPITERSIQTVQSKVSVSCRPLVKPIPLFRPSFSSHNSRGSGLDEDRKRELSVIVSLSFLALRGSWTVALCHMIGGRDGDE
jgi:hypothetical protein